MSTTELELEMVSPNGHAKQKALDSGAKAVGSEARPKPEVRIEIISPKRAEKWLAEANTHNRKLKERHVGHLANLILRDEFELTQDAIAFDTDGVLLNGQHRLSAVVVAGKSAQFIVVRGLTASAQATMDRVSTRSFADTLGFRQEKNITTLGSALNWLYRLDFIYRTGDVHPPQGVDKPTEIQLLAILDENYAGITEAVTRAVGIRNTAGMRMRNGLIGALIFKMWIINPSECDMFWHRMATGEELKKGDAIGAMRRYYMNMVKVSLAVPPYKEAALIIKTWNYWREERSIQQLNWTHSQLTKDPFPILQ